MGMMYPGQWNEEAEANRQRYMAAQRAYDAAMREAREARDKAADIVDAEYREVRPVKMIEGSGTD